MCGGFFNPFSMLLGSMLMGAYHDDYDPWANRREKSAAAQSRENYAVAEFYSIKSVVEKVMLEKAKVTVKLGCHSKSPSLLKTLPGILVEDICQFAGLPKATPRPAVAAAPAVRAAARDSNVISSTGGGREDVNLGDFSLYRPGDKITIPLLSPNDHLTGPCWRDFSKTVRWEHGWIAKRVAATNAQKAAFRETRKGKVYFVDLQFTVPGKPVKKRRNEAMTPSAKKARTGGPSRVSAVDTAPVAADRGASTSSRVKKANPEDARRALEAAIESGVNSSNGIVDEVSLKLAMGVGYSKQFILASVAKQRNDGDLKPAAK